MSDKQEKTKKVTIDVIDTPRGAVPTAEAFKNIIEVWNETVKLVNENLKKLVSALTTIEDSITALNTNINSLIRKVDVLANFMADIKVDIEKANNTLKVEMEAIKKIAAGSVKDSKKTSYDLLKDILLNENLREPGELTKESDLIGRCLDSIKEGKISVSKARLNRFLKERIVILEKEPNFVLSLAKTLAEFNKSKAYFIDLNQLKPKCVDKIDQLIEQIVSYEKGLIITFLNSQKIIGLPKYLDNIANSVKAIEKLKRIIDEGELSDKVLIFQVDDIKKVDPLILQKIKKLDV
ncbi:MAG: hypothetical protein ACP6IP_08570 [Candidatus Njordarchaeia archaeon]